jgi:hypothetical protein
MRPTSGKCFLAVALGLLTACAALGPAPLRAQAPGLTPFNLRDTQRNALHEVRSKANWLRSGTKTSARFPQAGFDMLVQQFQALCAAYNGFKNTLTPPQFNSAANDLAELDAGLGIISDAFAIFQDELAQGRAGETAFRDLSQALRDGSALWLQEFNRACAHLRIGP